MSAVRDYLELTKPRLTLLVLATTFLGFYMASSKEMPFDAFLLMHTLLAAAFLGGGINTLNQYMERSIDARMKRTAGRPIPAGRIQPGHALIFGLLLTFAGIGYLFASTNVLSGALGALTAVTYTLFYTPLKQKTTLNTLVGAIPGALPCVMGWAARQGTLPLEAWSIFGILFFWQLPHFFAIAWVYKEDYDKSGLKMLTLADPDGLRTGKKIVLSSLGLFLVTFLPVAAGLGHRMYLATAILFGASFVLTAFWICRRGLPGAKKFVSFSIYYLLALIVAMAADKLR